MTSKRVQLLWTVGAVWISLLLMITITYGGSIVIGGDYTDIGTIVIVSPKPGDTPQNNGTALLNNLATMPADVNNPYAIKLGPGIYDIGTSSLQMKQYVDIEGSGENTTIVTGNIDSNSSGVVQGASNAEIRFLTVRNTGGGGWAIAIYNTSASPKITNVTASASGGTINRIAVYNNSSSSPTMTNVTASASGGSGLSIGVLNKSSSSPTMTNVTASAFGGTTDNEAVYNLSSSPTMTNMTASASGGTTVNSGVYNFSSSPTMTNVTASASGGAGSRGIYNVFGSTIMINNSVITGSTNTIQTMSGTTTRVANTKLDGGPVDNGGTLTCVGAYNGNYVALGTDCQ